MREADTCNLLCYTPDVLLAVVEATAERKLPAVLGKAFVFNAEGDQEFLRLIGGFRRDRQTNEEGLTAAGLLMFGKLAEI